jgi:hypothetical protein
MSAVRKPTVQVSKWWTLPPVVIVLGFNILLERKRPMMPGLIHFLILLAASVISFGLGFSIAWLIGCLRDTWENS